MWLRIDFFQSTRNIFSPLWSNNGQKFVRRRGIFKVMNEVYNYPFRDKRVFQVDRRCTFNDPEYHYQDFEHYISYFYWEPVEFL